MKTILIIHIATPSRKKHFETVKKYNARTILFMKNPTWETECVDMAVDIDIKDTAKTIEAVREIQTTEHIDGVIAFCEHGVPAAAAVANALGLPFVSEATAKLARNKYEMRKAFVAHDVPCPKFELAADISEAKRICEDFGYPVVLKPLIGAGSLFIRRINNEAELEEHFEYIKKGAWETFRNDTLYEESMQTYKGAILIESYIPGGEVSVDSLTINGETHVIAICDKPLPMVGPYFGEVYFKLPSSLPESIQNEIIVLTKRANKALGINISASHTEFRITDEGKVVILENGARIGGAALYRSILTSTGIDMMNSIMDISLGITPNTTVLERKPVGDYMFFVSKEGVITDISGVKEVESAPDVVELQLYNKVGDAVLLPPKVSLAHGHIVIKGTSLSSLDDRVKELVSKIDIQVS